MYKKVNVVMLPTNEKATDIPFSVGITLCNDGKLRIGNPVGYSEKRQHLYITSDEEIKENDWVLLPNKEIHQMTPSDMIGYLDSQSKATKKIIATTDTSLGLPQPSQQFIEKYIEEYKIHKT